MTIQVCLHHETSYQYARSIQLGPQLVRLRPAYHARTKILSYNLQVEPAEHFVNWQQDPFANPIARYVFSEPTDQLKITVDLVADMTVINPFDFFLEEAAESWPFEYDAATKKQLAPYMEQTCDARIFKEWVAQLPKQADKVIDFLVEVNQATQARVEYVLRMEPGVQSPDRTLDLAKGSCRDSAWLLACSLRALGLATRFASGYLIQLTPDEKPVDGPAGPTDDFCDLHAWTEVFLPGAGWVGLDATSGLLAGEGHIPLACTPSPTDAAPVTGGHEPCEVEFHHEMSVTRILEDPRVTKPYTESAWGDMNAAGKAVDKVLRSRGLRLTMGGEPTFVSSENMEDPQWNTEAVGPEKRVLSNLLLKKLYAKFAPHGLLHYGQGKWYPGESLPRWALSCVWRKDGEPIWQDPSLYADEGREYQFTSEDAAKFVRHLAEELGIHADMSFPVYEDTFHYLWRENQLPVDMDPADPKLDDPNERAMMMRTFARGFSKPVGHVLPLRRAWWQARQGWVSGRWPIRSEKIFLIPGDSPIGLRLPLPSLPEGTAEATALHSMPLDPMAPRDPLPSPVSLRYQSVNDAQVGGEATEAQVEDESESRERELRKSSEVLGTALCIEERFGRIHVFMPPLQRLEDYLDLVNAVEQTAGALDIPVVIEGYLPPTDDRINILKVTPDPGVIEVNTQPAADWDELVHVTETIYDEAAQCHLGANKFDLDGRHTGTGGGAHIVLGGPTPEESPFHQRPDLLASMVRFWHNHPSLSYLFSGKFIGPTSQAPRMDEARRDAVYEMEIALSQLEGLPAGSPPWMVDRILRDLLVDLTGNTHRAEICIDKLFSPDSSTGRLGLVELRAFEMPPTARMNLAQQLLIRAAFAAFGEMPYRQRLVEWGTTLYDRYMLPHFVWRDFRGLVEDLNRHALKGQGVELDSDWFTPHFEFRYPKIGETAWKDIQLQLRMAIEPWYVMGEEPGGGGTARYVDSSVERIEVLVSGIEIERYAVLCNGRPLPLHPTGREQEYVAGVKFRAWQPPRCLHPTIGVDSPLQFDIVDRYNERSVAGCEYHVVNPAGISHETFPINASEAEARRSGRFCEGTISSGKIEVTEHAMQPSTSRYPVTLDLRRR